MRDKAMVMGDLVLLEQEVNPVISTLGTAGIQITALHNHFLGEQPRIMFMHIDGQGSPETLAEGIRKALSQTATPMPPAPASPTPVLPLDTKKIEQIIGHPGQLGGGVFKITIGRAGVTMSGMELTSSLGVNSWAAFMGNDDRAHVAGDIVMTSIEVNQVIKALRQGGVDIVAVHNHMLTEEPRTFFLHYWGTGPAAHLAQTVRTAFDQAKGPMR
jgi:biotin operon repressor